MSLPIAAATELLDSLLQAAADEGTRRYWEQYLKGSARLSQEGRRMAGARLRPGPYRRR